MRLTNTLRDAFIRAVLDDTPCADYQGQIEKALEAAALRAMPPKLRAIAVDKNLNEWLPISSVFGGTVGKTVFVPGSGKLRDEFRRVVQRDPEVLKLVEAHAASKAARDRLRSRLHAVAYSASTRKALADALPEFAHYLPADEAKALRTLPVVANVVADFVKAGWPKDKARKPVGKAAK